MNYFIAFYTKKQIILEKKIIDKCIFLDESYEIIDSFSAIKNNKVFYFDYLITDDYSVLKKLGVEFDNNYVLINYNFQTTLENTFAFSNLTTSSLQENKQIEKIIDFIEDN